MSILVEMDAIESLSIIMDEIVKNLYLSGQSTHQIAKEINISQTQVRRILERQNIQARSIKTSYDTEQLIIKQYKDGISSEIIATTLSMCPSTICRILKRNHIPLRSMSDSHRKYEINEDFLDNINTEEQAYFLGFMYTDGSVHPERDNISIVLHHKDKDILHKFSDIFYGQDRVVIRKDIYVAFNLYSKKLKEQLIKLGCPPRKTFIIKMPQFLSKDLVRHFIRGVFDGDGCYSHASNRIRIVLTGYIEFLEEIKQCILSYLPNIKITVSLTKGKTNVADLVIGKRADCVSFINWVYMDSKIHINRKFNLSQEILEICQ